MNKKNDYLNSKEILQLIVIMAMLAVCTAFVYQIARVADAFQEMANRKEDRGNSENIVKLVQEIDSIYSDYYIGDPITAEELEDGVLTGVPIVYDDPYGGYRTPEETEDFNANQNEMLLGGIGIQSIFENNMEYFEGYKYSQYIMHVYSDTPAERAGIKEGDRLVAVDGLKLTKHNQDEFHDAVKGEAGTDVTITLIRERDNGERYLEDITLTREDVINDSIFYEIKDNNIGYLKINTFSNKTDEEFTETINKLKSVGVEKFIIDIRDNNGGSADTVIRMLDSMLPSGLIVDIQYKDSSMNKTYYSDENEIAGEFVVLTNEYSASASELFAKALQEYGKAVIVGEVTYGKGTVISTVPLTNGGSITLSVAKYYTKSGENIEDIGVIPDYIVDIPDYDEMYLYKLDESKDLQLQKALEILRG